VAPKKLGKQTALYDAVWQFCDEKMRSVPGGACLVVITTVDTYSRANLRDAVDIAQRTETTIFCDLDKGRLFPAQSPALKWVRSKTRMIANMVKLAEEPVGQHFLAETC